MPHLDELYADVGLDFAPDQRSLFLHEMADVAESAGSELGGPKGRAGQPSRASRRRINALMDELGHEDASFAPQLDILPLRRSHFAAHGLQVPTRFAELGKRYDFYLVRFPITLIPRSGWRFDRLECAVAFNLDRPPKEQPLVYQAFPRELWGTVASLTGKLEVGLDSNFEFKTDLERLRLAVPNLDATVAAAVGINAHAGLGFVVEPQVFEFRRTRILCRGENSPRILWRFESEKDIDQEHLGVSVVLQVPRQATPVNVTAVLKASHSIRMLPPDIRALLGFLKERARNFFSQGAPLPDGREWRDVTAGL